METAEYSAETEYSVVFGCRIFDFGRKLKLLLWLDTNGNPEQDFNARHLTAAAPNGYTMFPVGGGSLANKSRSHRTSMLPGLIK
jgi:hypothetical protein